LSYDCVKNDIHRSKV